MNPLEMLKAIKNPQEFVNNYMKQNSNPILNNLIGMAQKNDVKGIETFARNFFKSQGQDYDQIMSQFK